MNPLFFTIFVLFSLISFGVGLFLVIKPELGIEFQRRFYAKINWKIEPISMEKEIRNTRIMGGFLLVISLATFIYISVFK